MKRKIFHKKCDLKMNEDNSLIYFFTKFFANTHFIAQYQDIVSKEIENDILNAFRQDPIPSCIFQYQTIFAFSEESICKTINYINSQAEIDDKCHFMFGCSLLSFFSLYNESIDVSQITIMCKLVFSFFSKGSNNISEIIFFEIISYYYYNGNIIDSNLLFLLNNFLKNLESLHYSSLNLIFDFLMDDKLKEYYDMFKGMINKFSDSLNGSFSDFHVQKVIHYVLNNTDNIGLSALVNSVLGLNKPTDYIIQPIIDYFKQYQSDYDYIANDFYYDAVSIIKYPPLDKIILSSKISIGQIDEEFFDSKWNLSLKIVTNGFRSIFFEILSPILKSIDDLFDEFNNNNCLIPIFFCLFVDSQHPDKKFILKYGKWLFDPQLAFYSPKSIPDKIMCHRKCFIEKLMIIDQLLVFEFIDTIDQYPLIVFECCCYLALNFGIIDHKDKFFNTFFHAFSYIVIEISNINTEIYSDSIILFLKFLKYHYIDNSYGYILVLLNVLSVLSDDFILVYLCLLRRMDNRYTEQFIEISLELLWQNRIKSLYSSICHTIVYSYYDGLVSLKKCQGLLEIIIQMHIDAHLCSSHILFEFMFICMNGINLSESLASSFTSLFPYISHSKALYLISGTPEYFNKCHDINDSTKFLFTIKNPEAIPIIMSFFSIQGNIGAFLQILKANIDYSASNIHALYKSEVSKILIHLLKEFPKGIIFDHMFFHHKLSVNEILLESLPIIISIFKYYSTFEDIEDFCQIIGSSCLEELHKNYIIHAFLSRLSKQLALIQNEIDLLRKSRIPKSSFISSHELLKGGLFVFWINIHKKLIEKLVPKTDKLTIFKLNTSAFNWLHLFVSTDSIELHIRQNSKISTFRVIEKIIPSEWIMISLYISGDFDSHQLNIESSTNTNPLSKVTSILEDIPDHKVDIVFGTEEETPEKNFSSFGSFLMRDFVLLPIKNGEDNMEEIQNLYYDYISFDYHLVFHNYHFLYQKPLNTRQNHFDFELIQKCKSFPIESCLPEYFTNSAICVNTLIDFSSLLFPDRFITLIPVLYPSFFPISSFHTYKQIYYIFESNMDLNRPLYFEKLLFNHLLWIQSKPVDLEQILNHMSTILIFSCIKEFREPNFLINLVSIIRLFYYFTLTNESYPVSRHPSINITKCLTYFRKIIDFLMEDRFSDSFLLTLLDASNKCLDPLLVEYFVHLFISFIPSSNNKNLFIKYLLTIDYSKNKDNFSMMIQALFLCSEETFYLQTQILSTQLPISFMPDLFFPLLKRVPALYAITIMCSLRSTIESQINVSSIVYSFSHKENILKQTKSQDMWMLWPLIFSVQTPDLPKNNMIYFVAQVILSDFQIEDLDSSLILLDIISLRTGLSPIPPKSILLKIICDSMLIRRDNRSTYQLFRRCFSSMFFEWRYTNFSLLLENEIENSPFSYSYKRSSIYSGPVKSYQDLKAFQFDHSKAVLGFILTESSQFKSFQSDLIVMIKHLIKNIKDEKIPSNNLINSILEYPSATSSQKQSTIRQILDSIDSIISEYQIFLTPLIIDGSKNLYAFLKNLDSQVHNISKGIINQTELSDMRQLYLKTTEEYFSLKKEKYTPSPSVF